MISGRGVGLNDPHEVCTYPDSGKVMVRSLKTVGRLTNTDYLDGERDVPRVLSMAGSTPARAAKARRELGAAVTSRRAPEPGPAPPA